MIPLSVSISHTVTGPGRGSCGQQEISDRKRKWQLAELVVELHSGRVTWNLSVWEPLNLSLSVHRNDQIKTDKRRKKLFWKEQNTDTIYSWVNLNSTSDSWQNKNTEIFHCLWGWLHLASFTWGNYHEVGSFGSLAQSGLAWRTIKKLSAWSTG